MAGKFESTLGLVESRELLEENFDV